MNLNDEAQGPCYYMCFYRDNSAPICDIDIQSNILKKIPYGYIPIMYSPSLSPIHISNTNLDLTCKISIFRNFEYLLGLNLINTSYITPSPSPLNHHKKVTIFFDDSLDTSNPYIPDEENDINNITDTHKSLEVRKAIRDSYSLLSSNNENKLLDEIPNPVINEKLSPIYEYIPKKTKYLFPFLVGCYCKDIKIIKVCIETFKALLKSNFYSYITSDGVPILEIIIDHITLSGIIYPNHLWKNILSFTVECITEYKRISNISFMSLILTLIDGFIKECKNVFN